MSLLHALKNIDDFCHGLSRSKSVLFEVMNGFGFECQAPVINALRAYPHINVGITTSGLGDEALTQAHTMASDHGQYFIAPKKATWKKWDLVICTDARGVWYQRNHKTAYLQHGISGRGNYPYDGNPSATGNHQSFDYLFASSIDIARHCVKQMPQLSDTTDIRIVGFPLLDSGFNKGTSTSLPSPFPSTNKPTVLFCSHWDQYSLLKTIGHDVLTLLSQQRHYNVLLTAHPYNWDREEMLFTEHKDWKAYFQGFAQHEHVHFIPEPNITRVMPLVDLLISDHSSSSIEYCALDTPVFRFHHPQMPMIDTDLSHLINKATQAFQSAIELQQLLQKGIVAGTQRAEREQLSQYCYVNPGAAADATAKEVVTICG